MTEEFLDFSKRRGNDLTTPPPELDFRLDSGDRWCVRVDQWLGAVEAGTAPPVVLKAANESVLGDVPVDDLKEHVHRE